MRKLIAVAAAAVIVASCGTITDSVSIDIDIDGIIATTCANFADQLSRQIETQLADLTDESGVALPDLDIEAAIDRAQDLGCSPEDMRALITENLDEVGATTEKAREVLEDLREQAGQ